MSRRAQPRGEIQEYLLGRLPPDRTEAIEQRILADGDFHEEVVMGEEDLLESYVDGELSQEERTLFHKHFLKSKHRQRRLLFALALKRKVQIAEAPALPLLNSVPPRWWAWRPYPYALAASLLVVLALGIADFALTRRLHDEHATRERLGRELQEAQLRLDSPFGGHSSREPLAVASLVARITRGSELARVMVPSGIQAVQFALSVPPDFQHAQSIDLLDDADHVITTASAASVQLIGDSPTLITIFPAKYLKSGNYFLRIVADNPALRPLWCSFKVQTS